MMHTRGYAEAPANTGVGDGVAWAESLAQVLPGTPAWPGFYYRAGTSFYWEAAPNEPSDAYRRASDTSIRQAALRWAKAGCRRAALRLTAHGDPAQAHPANQTKGNT